MDILLSKSKKTAGNNVVRRKDGVVFAPIAVCPMVLPDFVVIQDRKEVALLVWSKLLESHSLGIGLYSFSYHPFPMVHKSFAIK